MLLERAYLERGPFFILGNVSRAKWVARSRPLFFHALKRVRAHERLYV